MTAFPDPKPGDIYIVNDPYIAGTHLNDVRLVMPVFGVEGRLCWIANCGHWPDIGGMAPGSYATDATEIYQEGVRIPPLRFVREGVLNEEMLQLLLANVRGKPSDRIGDVDAQINSLKVGERRVSELVARFSEETFLEAVAELSRRADQATRAVIRDIPDGDYEAEAWLDDDGVNFDPIRLNMRISVRGERMIFDLSGCPGPVGGSMNAPPGATRTACFAGLKHIWPEIPVSGGSFRPLEFVLPSESILSAHYPSAVSGCTTETIQRVVELVYRALAPVLGERACACFYGTSSIYALAGEDPEQTAYVLIAFTGGGYGAGARTDGLHNGSTVVSMARGLSLEIMESRFPILYTRAAIREDSGGAGARRGGVGTELSFRLQRGTGKFSLLGDRGRFGAWGLEGGEPGATALHDMVVGGEAFVPPHVTKVNNLPLNAGDIVNFRTPGGGGHGNPRERPVDLVLRDVRAGYVSDEKARETYAVACRREGEAVVLDEAATVALRGKNA
jgi:N-methylhydantoinase B